MATLESPTIIEISKHSKVKMKSETSKNAMRLIKLVFLVVLLLLSDLLFEIDM